MTGWDAFWSVLSGAAGGVVGAGATVWATNRTLRQQVEQTREESDRATEGAFEYATQRADKQLITALSLLRLFETPKPPFVTFDHDALDDLLSYQQVPLEVAFEVERLAFALRSYNAAADWGNDKNLQTDSGKPAIQSWETARDMATATFAIYKGWRGEAIAPLNPLVEE